MGEIYSFLGDGGLCRLYIGIYGDNEGRDWSYIMVKEEILVS